MLQKIRGEFGVGMFRGGSGLQGALAGMRKKNTKRPGRYFYGRGVGACLRGAAGRLLLFDQELPVFQIQKADKLVLKW